MILSQIGSLRDVKLQDCFKFWIWQGVARRCRDLFKQNTSYCGNHCVLKLVLVWEALASLSHRVLHIGIIGDLGRERCDSTLREALQLARDFALSATLHVNPTRVQGCTWRCTERSSREDRCDVKHDGLKLWGQQWWTSDIWGH